MADQLKACPFCGMKPPKDLEDTLYPTGSFWRELNEEGLEGLRHYFRRESSKPGDGMVWGMHCTTNMGGCGAEIRADSEQEVIDAWNTRAEPVGVPTGDLSITVQAGDGLQLVPAEPTDAMTFIGQSMRYDSANSIGAIYRAMLSAAPSQPVVRWDLFPGWLIDHCEGEILTEELLQMALGDMINHQKENKSV